MINVFWRQLQPKLKGKWKPPVREGAGMLALPDRGVLLFGGLSHNLLSDLNFLQSYGPPEGSLSSKSKTTTSSPTRRQEWCWSTEEPRRAALKIMDGRDNLIPINPSSRCGHSTALLDMDKMVIYGGQ